MISDAGRPPADLCAREAHQELLKTTDIYSEESRSTVEPYEAERLKLLRGGVRPRDSMEFVPEHVRAVLRRPDVYIERHSDELEGEPHVEPYWDPQLDPSRAANRGRLVGLLRRLAELGIVVATQRKKATVGLFFVRKKNNLLRMIVDGRQPNQYHRLPPHACVASIEALGAISVEAAWRSSERAGRELGRDGMIGGSIDLQDGFHQFLNPIMAPWFVFNLGGMTAGELGVGTMWDGEKFTEVASDQPIWPAYGGMAMGWSWALWVCHETLASVLDAVREPEDGWVVDKASAPDLGGGGAGLAPYVDNANVVSLKPGVVKARLAAVARRLDELGLVWHEYCDEALEVEILGVVLDGRRLAVRPKPRRAWRLYLGLGLQIAMGRATGWHIRALTGHVVSFFQLQRPCLSVLRATYDFFQKGDLGELRVLPKEVLDELRVVKGLVHITQADLGARACPVAYMTDASMKGFAVLETDIEPDELFPLVAHRERNRFRIREKYVEREHDGFKGMLASPAQEADWWDGVLHLPRHVGRAPRRQKVEEPTGVAPPSLPDEFVQGDRWHLVVAGAWKHPSRIHEYEARGELMSLQKSAGLVRHHGCVLLTANDNMGSVCAYEKGRAADLGLLALCRRAAALQVSCGIQWRQRHVEGVRNAADFMSRAADRGQVRPGQLLRGARGGGTVSARPAREKARGGRDGGISRQAPPRQDSDRPVGQPLGREPPSSKAVPRPSGIRSSVRRGRRSDLT